jgi:hypothetical protein
LAERIPQGLPGRIGRAELKQADPIDLPRLLRLGGERRGEEGASESTDERPSMHASSPPELE